MAQTASIGQMEGKKSSQILDKVLSPFTYLTKSPSKNLSRKTGLFFNQWLKSEEKYVSAVGDICDMFHQSTLL